jgi:hypothetical protein
MALPYTFGTQTGTIPLNELDENFAYLENLVPALAVAAGTVISASQPNITALGTLSGLNCTGTITSGTVTADIINGTLSVGSQPNITEIGTLANLTVTNTLLVGTVTATTVGSPGASLVGTVATPAQPNITSLGTLSVLAVSGAITGTLATAAQPNITSVGTLSSLAVSGAVTASTLSAGSISGTLTTAAQPNITSVGTLTALSVSGAITGTLATAAQPNITSVGTLSSLSVSGAITGTLATSAQPNVTSVGTLASLSVSGTSALSGEVTAPTAANGAANTQVATTAFVSNSLSNILPSGVIVMWSGSVASIPAGWLLCNGSNGTPDLRDRFVVGAGSTYNPAATGGSANAIVVSHTHSATSVVTDPGHAHSYNAPSGTDDGGFGGSVVDSIISATTGAAATGITVATTISSSGSSGTNANLPPYYALAYIMKA